jgi:hypothetical protein
MAAHHRSQQLYGARPTTDTGMLSLGVRTFRLGGVEASLTAFGSVDS